MRIPSAKVDQNIYFVAVDSTDLKTRETGLTNFTVYRSRNGGAATVYTTPTVAELSAVNMPGVYALLIDEDTTIAAGSDSEEYVVHITQAAMAPVSRTIELYRRPVTTGNTLDVTATGAAGIDWANIENQTTAVNLSATNIDVDQVVASVTGAVGSVTGLTAANLDVAVSTRMATYVQPTGFLAATFPTTVASTTNITAGTITTTTNLTNLPSIPADWITSAGIAAGAITSSEAPALANLDAAVSSRMATYTQPTGFLAATFPALVASTTNITAGTITTTTNLTNLPTIPANWITAAGINASALNGKGDWNIGKTGYTLVSGPLDAAGTRTALGMATDNLDAQIATLLTAGAYTAPDNASITAIKAKTDNLTFTVPWNLDTNIEYVNGVEVTGDGTSGTPWGPA